MRWRKDRRRKTKRDDWVGLALEAVEPADMYIADRRHPDERRDGGRSVVTSWPQVTPEEPAGPPRRRWPYRRGTSGRSEDEAPQRPVTCSDPMFHPKLTVLTFAGACLVGPRRNRICTFGLFAAIDEMSKLRVSHPASTTV
jgi:hypothetical protein